MTLSDRSWLGCCSLRIKVSSVNRRWEDTLTLPKEASPTVNLDKDPSTASINILLNTSTKTKKKSNGGSFCLNPHDCVFGCILHNTYIKVWMLQMACYSGMCLFSRQSKIERWEKFMPSTAPYMYWIWSVMLKKKCCGHPLGTKNF